jgi:hypothetical protein
MMMLRHCTFEGCPKTTENWLDDRWAHLDGWGIGVREGYYCREHADALEALLENGELEEIQSSPPSDDEPEP